MNRSMLEAELKTLIEVSTDFSRGLSTVAARMKVLKSCLDKLPASRVSRVDRATSPIVFRTDRSTSVSPLRFKSPEEIKIKEEKVDKEETAEVPEERNYCDINVNQEESTSYNNKENSIDYSQVRTNVLRHEQQSMEVNGNLTSNDNNDVPNTITNRILTLPTECSSNIRRSYYILNQTNGLAIPVDGYQLKVLRFSTNPVHQVTVQHHKPLEEDILYALQVNEKERSSEDVNKLARVEHAPINRKRGIRQTNEEKRPYNRVRQAQYRVVYQRKMNDCNKKIDEKRNMENNLHVALNDSVNNDLKHSDAFNVFTLRKDQVTKTYARRNRHMETS